VRANVQTRWPVARSCFLARIPGYSNSYKISSTVRANDQKLFVLLTTGRKISGDDTPCEKQFQSNVNFLSCFEPRIQIQFMLNENGKKKR